MILLDRQSQSYILTQPDISHQRKTTETHYCQLSQMAMQHCFDLAKKLRTSFTHTEFISDGA